MNDVEKQMREMAVGDVMQIERAGKIVCVPGGLVVESQIGKWCLSYREAPTKEQRRAVRDVIESGAVARIKPPGNGRGVRLVASC